MKKKMTVLGMMVASCFMQGMDDNKGSLTRRGEQKKASYVGNLMALGDAVQHKSEMPDPENLLIFTPRDNDLSLIFTIKGGRTVPVALYGKHHELLWSPDSSRVNLKQSGRVSSYDPQKQWQKRFAKPSQGLELAVVDGYVNLQQNDGQKALPQVAAKRAVVRGQKLTGSGSSSSSSSSIVESVAESMLAAAAVSSSSSASSSSSSFSSSSSSSSSSPSELVESRALAMVEESSFFSSFPGLGWFGGRK